jgi:hypothetical protein
MPKKLAIVKPSVVLVKDETGKTIRGDYHYPSAPGCTAHVICYNRDQGPPAGDFLQEQMWSISGPQEGLDVFFSDDRANPVTRDQARSMGVRWDGEKEVPDKIDERVALHCPDCNTELVCPNKICDTGAMVLGKAPKATRTKSGWNPADHAHHIDDAED